MASLNAPMTDSEIQKLDYFDKARLYHNVYKNFKYSQLPSQLRQFRTEDNGLKVVKGVIAGQNVKEPYTIVNLIKILCPEKPTTYQQVYGRAAFLADLCDTSVSKIIKSNIFNPVNFIPNLKEDVLKAVLETKGSGTIKDLSDKDYIPYVDPDDDSKENKIYFVEKNGVLTPSKSFSEIKALLPDLPSAELIFEDEDSLNLQNISAGYEEEYDTIHYNFIKLYDEIIELYTVHCNDSATILEANSVNIHGGEI